jgi:hypothetical protein
MRKAIKFYISYFEVASELSDKDRLAFYDALFNKQFKNIEPDLKGMAKFAYISQKHSIDAQIKGYYDITKDEQFNPNQPPTQGGTQGAYQPPIIQDKEEDKEEVKEKEKEQYINKKIKIRENVFISQSNLDKLYSEYLEHEVSWMLDKLNDYKASKGVQYKSDYHAINMWVKDAFKKAKVDFVKDNNTAEVRIKTALNGIENINWDDYKLL